MSALDVDAAIAELAVLYAYDRERQARGHDYGGGQRAGELIRRERALIAAGARSGQITNEAIETVEPELLERAWRRVGAPRLARAERDRARFHTRAGAATPTDRTIRAWRRLEERVGKVLGVAAKSEAELEADSYAEPELDEETRRQAVRYLAEFDRRGVGKNV